MKDTAALDLSKNTAVEVLMCLSEWRQFSETPFQSTPKNKNSQMKVQQSTDLSQESVIDNPENRTVSVSVPHSTSFEVRTSSKNPSSHQHIENPAIPISMSPPSNEIFPGFNLGNNDQNDDLFNTNKERNHDEGSNGQTKTNMDQPPNSLLNINQNQHQTSSGLPNTSQNQSQSSNGLLNNNGDPNNPSRVNNSKEFNKMEWDELRRKEISECSCSTCGEDDSSCFETDEDSDSNDVEGEVTIIAERFHSKPTDNRLKMLGQPAKTRGRQPPGASLNRKTSKNLEATKTKRSYTKKNSLVQDTKCGNQKQDKESQPSCNKDSRAARVITKSFETPQPRYATRFGSMKTEMKDKPIDLPANSNPLDVAAANKFDESSSNESFLPENPFTGSPTKKFKLFSQVPVKTYRKKKSSPSKSSRTFDKASSLQVDKKIKGTKKQVDPKKRDTSKSSMEHDSAKMTKHKLKASKNGAKIKPSPEVQIEKSKFQIEELTSVTVPNPSEAEPTTSMKTIEEEKNGSKWFDSLSGRDKCEKFEDLTRINDEIVQDVSPVKMTRIGQSIIFVADDGKVYGKEVCNNIEAKSKPSSNKDEITQNDGTDDQKMPSEDHFDEITNDSLLAEQTVNESTGAKSKPLLSLEETIPMVELAKVDGNNSEVKSIAKSHASSVATSLENPPNPTKRQSTEAMKSTPTKKIKSLDGTHDIGDSQQVSPGSLTKLGKTKSAAFVPKPCKIRTRSSYKKMDD